MRIGSDARQVLQRALDDGDVPCVVALASGDEQPTALGRVEDGGAPARGDTLFDLASLTKVVATLPAVLRLIAERQISPDDPVERFFSNAGWFQSPSLGQATVRQLLTHGSGLPAWVPFFARTSERTTALAALLQTPLAHEPGTVTYSDLGFMLLGAIAERVTGVRLDEFVTENVLAPLGMNDTSFGPVEAGRAAPTEDCGWRGRLLRGEVHDENASVWQGVAGHAGLFGTAGDLGRYCRAWLELDARLGPEELLVEATGLQAGGGTHNRGYGWLLSPQEGLAAPDADGYGHTGFTGTSLWIDLPTRTAPGGYAILLSNRVYPHRGLRTGMTELRVGFHRALRAQVQA